MRVELVKLVTGREMAEIDRRTIEETGVPGAELMERAGREVFRAMAARWDGLEGLSAVVVCGRGNNGGDGFVVARHLLQQGVPVRVFLAGEKSGVRGDAAHHLGRLEKAGGQVEEVVGQGDLERLEKALAQADVAVDALLGTGFRGAPRPEMEQLIERLARAGRPVVAIDLPSGVEADTGRVPGACVRAALTVTFGVPKIGQMFYPGRAHCGTLHLAEIGFPQEVIRSVPSTAFLLTRETMAELVPRREGDAHKGTCGSVVVVAGSAGMTGAAALAADTALLAGAGRVSLGVPASLNDILEVKLTEVMTRPLSEVRRRRCLSRRALGEILELLEGAQVLALGPGLGRYRETVELVRCLVKRCNLPLVLDADGLNACAGATDILKNRPQPLVLTPHVGEFARLSGLDKEEILQDPMGAARDFAGTHRLTLVLKGAPTVVALADGRVAVNSTGNPGMATAGSGDVLTGLIAGLLAQGLEPQEAACLGVFAHGRAGDLAGDRIGQWGLKAGDISREVPQALLDTYQALGEPT
jgi:NAD(P)H-hydrate epimerase